MKVQYVTAYMAVPGYRNKDYYSSGINKWRRVFNDDLTVYCSDLGLQNCADFSEDVLKELLGRSLFDRIETARVLYGARIKYMQLPFFMAVTHVKLKLLERMTTMSDSDLFYWIDAGLPSHYMTLANNPHWFNLENFWGRSRPDKGFCVIKGNWWDDWLGGNFEQLLDFPGTSRSIGAGIMGGDRDSISKVTEIYYSILDHALSSGAACVDEDVLTYMSVKYPDLLSIYQIGKI